MLQKSGKPVVLCVNKCDQIGEPPAQFYEFYNLGLGEPIQVSSVHGTGTGDLLEEVCKFLPPEDEAELDEDVISVAVIGKPNVGKSSLINYITGENRCIVSDIAGTTRESIDTIVENEYGKFNFIDTAGMRRKARVYDNIEKYSIIRARMAIDRCDVCVIMIDAEVGYTEQDSKVAGMALEAGKGCIIAVNKWDAIDKDTHTMGDFRKTLDREFAFMSYTPYIFISAKTGQRVNNLFELITTVANNPNAIGYASLAALQDSVKALTVGGVAPSEATVKDGSYVIQRPFVLVTKTGTHLSEVAQKFFDFATSAEANDLISKAGAVPVK